MARSIYSRTVDKVRVTTAMLVLLLLLHTTLFSIAAADTDAPHRSSAPQPDHQTSVLNRLWWRNLEEQDAFIQSLFRKPLATANIGVVTSTTTGSENAAAAATSAAHSAEAGAVQRQPHRGRQGGAPQSRGVGHHAPANTTGPERRLFIPKLNFVYTITEETKRAQEAETATRIVASAPANVEDATASGATYTQMLRSVLPMGLGGSAGEEGEAKRRPLTPLETAAMASPIFPLRAYVMDPPTVTTVQQEANMQAATPEAEGGLSSGERRAVVEAADGVAHTNTAADGLNSLSHAQNAAEETLVVVSSSTKAVVPLTVVGTSYTVVQFAGKAGNTINAVVQLKDHRYDDSVSTRNCYNMYLKVELRNHVKTGNTQAESEEASATAQGSTQPHAYVNRDQWSGASSTNSEKDEDISTANRGSWSTFWDSFALMFDTSALCKVLPSVSMRVSRAPQTEPFYVVLRSTTGYAFETAYYYNTTSGSFYTNTKDDDYVCDLDLFIEQWPAAEQERLQLIFSFIIPLLVLLLPLPLTMRRADLVQQYMMETDYAEWVWRPPYYLRNRMIDGLKGLVGWVMKIRNAYQQQSLRAQLLQRQQQHVDGHLPAQTLLTPPVSAHNRGPVNTKMEDTRNTQLPHFTASPTPAPATAAPMQTHPSSPPPPLLPTAAAVPRDGAALPSGEEGEERARGAGEQHRACTPRRQFKESQSAPSSQASDASHLDHSSTGSDFDEAPDGRTRCAQQLPPSLLHSRQCSEHPGAVSPPHSQQQQQQQEEGVLCTRAGGAVPLPGIGLVSSGQALVASEEEFSNNRRSHRCHHLSHHSCRCHHSKGSRDGGVGAVSVHVPFSIESPVQHSPRVGADGNHASSYGGRGSAHDLLFTTAEATGTVGGVASPREALLQRRSREETEAQNTPGRPPQQATTAAAGSGLPQREEASSSEAAAAASPAAREAVPTAAEEEDAEEPFCRICREGNDVAPLITPCGCTGSVRFVHAACLDRWRLESAKRNLANVNHCEICKLPFTVNIRRSTLIWESSQHILRGLCLFFTCCLVVVLTTTLTHGILGELSCLASYHEVAYGTMFRFEGLSLSLFVYGLAVLLVLFANLIVYSWFRSRPEVEEYVAEMHAIPPFYTRHNMVRIVLVCLLLLAQVHAMGFLLKYFLYNTSHLVWSWETSPLVGGMLFALFTTCSITVCSWGRQMYVLHVVNGGNGANPAEDVVVEGGAAPPPPAAAAADTFAIPTSTTLNYVHPADAPTTTSMHAGLHGFPAALTAAAEPQTTAAEAAAAPGSPSVILRAAGDASTAAALPVEEDVTYSRHFAVPPEQRVIRAYEYCPPRKKVPK